MIRFSDHVNRDLVSRVDVERFWNTRIAEWLGKIERIYQIILVSVVTNAPIGATNTSVELNSQGRYMIEPVVRSDS